MNTLKLCICAIFSIFFYTANAQTNGIKPQTIYGYGMAISIEDKIVCFTEVQELPKAQLTKKQSFLVNRNKYSNQLECYTYKDSGKKYICVTFFDTTKAKLNQQISKLKRKYSKKKEFQIIDISKEHFTFKDPIL